MDALQERPDISELSADDIAAIEQRVRGLPDSWCEFARSAYITLAFAGSAPMQKQQAADMAMALMYGIVNDMGGTQPYIQVGKMAPNDALVKRVLDLLRANQQDYERVAALLGWSARHVRRIESRWIRAERARRQTLLPGIEPAK